MTAQTHRFDVTDFYRMGEAGILREDQRVELLDGDVSDMMPIGPYHSSRVDTLMRIFVREDNGGYLLRVQNPLRLSEFSEVLPDIALVAPRAHRYSEAHPGAEDTLLVIEVADSTVARDRNVKLPLYARAGIEEVWIVNVPMRQVEVYRGPNYLEYSEHIVLGAGQSAAPLAFPDISIPVAELFG